MEIRNREAVGLATVRERADSGRRILNQMFPCTATVRWGGETRDFLRSGLRRSSYSSFRLFAGPLKSRVSIDIIGVGPLDLHKRTSPKFVSGSTDLRGRRTKKKATCRGRQETNRNITSSPLAIEPGRISHPCFLHAQVGFHLAPHAANTPA